VRLLRTFGPLGISCVGVLGLRAQAGRLPQLPPEALQCGCVSHVRHSVAERREADLRPVFQLVNVWVIDSLTPGQALRPGLRPPGKTLPLSPVLGVRWARGRR